MHPVIMYAPRRSSTAVKLCASTGRHQHQSHTAWTIESPPGNQTVMLIAELAPTACAGRLKSLSATDSKSWSAHDEKRWQTEMAFKSLVVQVFTRTITNNHSPADAAIRIAISRAVSMRSIRSGAELKH
jgi:hypothetical protein